MNEQAKSKLVLAVFMLVFAGAGLAVYFFVSGVDTPEPQPAAAPQPPLFFELHSPKPELQAVIDGSWKLIRGRGNASGAMGLYDLRRDPPERYNLAHQHPETVARLAQQIDRFAERLPAPPTVATMDVLDPALAERLRALGYVEDTPDAGAR